MWFVWIIKKNCIIFSKNKKGTVPLQTAGSLNEYFDTNILTFFYRNVNNFDDIWSFFRLMFKILKLNAESGNIMLC